MKAPKVTNIGAPAAERDELLPKCFVGTHIFEAVLANQCSVLLGNRGSGKSAIFRQFKQSQKLGSTGVIDIVPEDYSYEIVSSTLSNQIDHAWAKQAAFSAAWKYVLLMMAFRSVRDRSKDAKSASYLAINRYLKKKFGAGEFDIIGQLIDYLKRFKSASAAGVGIEFSPSQLQNLYKLQEVSDLFNHFRDLASQAPVVILIDELDRGWDASESARLFVAGIFQAAMWLNLICPDFRVLVSLRRELYDNIPELFDDAQKYRDVLRYLEWDEAKLKELAGLRIKEAMSLPKSTTADQAWSWVFADTLSYRNTESFNYIVDRTLYRPREIIQFVNDCLQNWSDRSFVIDYSVITAAEKSYSGDRFQDICSEYRFQYPGLKEVLNNFRGRIYRFSKVEIDALLSEIIKKRHPSAGWLERETSPTLLEKLFEIGFIKALAIGGEKGVARSGSKWVGYYQSPNIDLSRIETFHVHPMFRSHLNMKEK